MDSEQTIATSDLRSAAQDYKRDHEHKHKWAFGQQWGPGRSVDSNPAPAKRIAETLDLRREMRSAHPCQEHRSKSARKFSMFKERYASSESSAEEEVEEASAAPEPDADVAYSFDAARGPGHGSQILSMAVAQAVERYENRVTDKLVQEEYEVLDMDGESVVASPRKVKGGGILSEEEDFELV